MPIPRGPQLHPYLTVVHHSERTLQIGLVPQEAVLVDVPEHYTVDDVQWLLSRCDGQRTMEELKDVFGCGQHQVMAAHDVEQLLGELIDAGVAHPGDAAQHHHKITVGIVGSSRLAEQIRSLLSHEDTRIVEWCRLPRQDCDVVVVADTIVPDPVVVRELMDTNRPFLVCTVVDNRGIVGPLVVPASSPDELRKQRLFLPLDTVPAHIAASLSREEGQASQATVAATAAFALSLLLRNVCPGEVIPYYRRMIVAPDAHHMAPVSLPHWPEDAAEMASSHAS